MGLSSNMGSSKSLETLALRRIAEVEDQLRALLTAVLVEVTSLRGRPRQGCFTEDGESGLPSIVYCIVDFESMLALPGWTGSWLNSCARPV